MKAIKGNKVYIVDEKSKGSYLKSGFDIYDDEGNIKEYAANKTVSMAEFMMLKKENESLRLASMTVDQLKAYAVDKNIELGEATTKDALLKIIKGE